MKELTKASERQRASPCRSFLFLVSTGEPNVQSQWTRPGIGPVPAYRSQHAPAQFRLKKVSSVGVVCGNDSSFTNKADLLVTDGINSEYEQESRQSSQDARPDKQGGHPTSRRRIRDSAGQHGRGGGTPSHQPTLDRGIRATHQADATPAGSATDLGRP